MTLLPSSVTGELLPALTEEEARDLTERIRSTAESLWELLAEAHDRHAWKALGFGSFAEYVAGEFGMSRRHAYRLLDQRDVIRELEEAAGVTHGSHEVDVTEREARDIKPQLSEVTAQVRTSVTNGAKPRDAVRSAVTSHRSPPPARPVPAPEPEADPSVDDVVTVVPWSFAKEITPHDPRTAKDATTFFDAKVIKNPDLWHRHLDAIPARLRAAAALEAQQQAAHWQEAVDRLNRPTRPRSV